MPTMQTILLFLAAALPCCSACAYVLQKIGRGLEDMEAGRVLSEEEFDHRFAKWLEA